MKWTDAELVSVCADWRLRVWCTWYIQVLFSSLPVCRRILQVEAIPCNSRRVQHIAMLSCYHAIRTLRWRQYASLLADSDGVETYVYYLSIYLPVCLTRRSTRHFHPKALNLLNSWMLIWRTETRSPARANKPCNKINKDTHTQRENSFMLLCRVQWAVHNERFAADRRGRW